MGYNVVIIDSRNGTDLDEATTAAMAEATVVYLIEQGYVRALPGEKFSGEFPKDFEVSFHTALTEAEVSLRQAQETRAAREAEKKHVEGEDPLIKARRALEPSS